jgi:hypothetical protein
VERGVDIETRGAEIVAGHDIQGSAAISAMKVKNQKACG